jgi:hypothetical protein
MTVGIVDLLEIVQVHHDQRQGMVRERLPGNFVLEILEQKAAVVDARRPLKIRREGSCRYSAENERALRIIFIRGLKTDTCLHLFYHTWPASSILIIWQETLFAISPDPHLRLRAGKA